MTRQTSRQKRNRGVIVRNPEETVLTFNLPITLKESLKQRAEAADTSMAKLLVWAVLIQEKRNWSDIPQAQPIVR